MKYFLFCRTTILMRLLIAIAFLLIIVAACKPAKQKTIIDKQIDLSQKFKPILHGVWVPADYVAELVNTRSPHKASEHLKTISEFVIDTSGNSQDSLEVGISLGNHEGSQFVLYFKKGQSLNSLLTNISDFGDENGSYELGFVANVPDTFLMLYHYDKNKKLIDQTKYIKVKEVQPGKSLEDGFQYMVNKKLIAGIYKATDTTGKEFTVTLDNDGSISGFPNRKTYYTLTDFVAEDEEGPDEICFDIQTSDQNCYGFEMKGDTINLFKPQENKGDTMIQKNPVLYTLVKQK
jgi:hypothetical protein